MSSIGYLQDYSYPMWIQTRRRLHPLGSGDRG
jgi:hypothetical protein